MPQIGSLSSDKYEIIFETSDSRVNTISNASWTVGANYKTHDRHLNDALPELVGLDADTFTFRMQFHEEMGVEPLDEMSKLLRAQREGEVMRLNIGGHGYGKYKWVITKTAHTLDLFDRSGKLYYVETDVTLMGYPQS